MTFDREIGRECLNWRFYAGGALIKVADSVILTVHSDTSIKTIKNTEIDDFLKGSIVNIRFGVLIRIVLLG